MALPKTTKSRNDAPVPAAVRLAVFTRDHFACVYCGAAGVDLALDHVTPRSWAGSNKPANLATACEECNSGDKGGMDLVSYARKLRALGAPAAEVAMMVARVRRAVRRPLPKV